jgi:hypothetical protein
LPRRERPKVKDDQILERVNLAFLHYAGYDDTDIAKLGDLSKLPERKMHELINDKAEKALAEALKGTVTKPFGEEDKEEPEK